jgi:hypothetical protein
MLYDEQCLLHVQQLPEYAWLSNRYEAPCLIHSVLTGVGSWCDDQYIMSAQSAIVFTWLGSWPTRLGSIHYPRASVVWRSLPGCGAGGSVVHLISQVVWRQVLTRARSVTATTAVTPNIISTCSRLQYLIDVAVGVTPHILCTSVGSSIHLIWQFAWRPISGARQ